MPYRFSTLTTACHCLDNVVANRFIIIGKFTFLGCVTYSGIVLLLAHVTQALVS